MAGTVSECPLADSNCFDPNFECDAPKFYNFAATGEDCNSLSDDGGSWFERHEESFVSSEWGKHQVASETQSSSPPQKGVLINSSGNAETEELNMAATSPEKPPITEPEPDVVAPEEKEDLGGSVTVTVPGETEDHALTETTSNCMQKDKKREPGKHDTRSRDRTKKVTAGSVRVPLKKSALPNTMAQPDISTQLKKRTVATHKAQAGIPTKPPLAARGSLEAFKGPTGVTHAKPFHFRTDKRLERRSVERPRREPTPERHLSAQDAFEHGLRSYLPSPMVRGGKTIPKPFHLHESRKRSSSDPNREGGQRGDSRADSASPKKITKTEHSASRDGLNQQSRPPSDQGSRENLHHHLSSRPTGTVGMSKPKIKETTKAIEPTFATEKRVARRTASVDKNGQDKNVKTDQGRGAPKSEVRGRPLPRRTLDPGVFSKPATKKQPPSDIYTGPTLRPRIGSHVAPPVHTSAHGQKVNEIERKTETGIAKQREVTQRTIDKQTRKLRDLTVFKAQPIRKYKPVEIKHEQVKVTSPVSPQWASKSRADRNSTFNKTEA